MIAENITGRHCRTLAYPYGLFDERAQRAVTSAGHELAFQLRRGGWSRFAAQRLATPIAGGGGRLILKMLSLRRPQWGW
jgi:hypothetical protein